MLRFMEQFKVFAHHFTPKSCSTIELILCCLRPVAVPSTEATSPPLVWQCLVKQNVAAVVVGGQLNLQGMPKTLQICVDRERTEIE